MTTNELYKSSPTKRKRRSKAEMDALCESLIRLVREQQPMTCRQVFYQAVSRGLIDKTEAEYKNTICRVLANLRRGERIPFNWIADNTRWMRKPRTYSSLEQMLYRSQNTYRRAIWDEQEAYVEIWLEKEALAGVLFGVTARWDVPLMVTRGYSSLSFLNSAAEAIKAEAIKAEGRPTYIYYFGDFDPSGVDISRRVEKDLRHFASGVELHFERVAVNEDQISEFDLPTRPTKRTDSRSKNFKGESVEVDAFEPATLRGMAENVIVKHIDRDLLEKSRMVENAEKETLRAIIEQLESGNV